MRYFSDVLNKPFDTEEILKEAEKKYFEEKEKEKASKRELEKNFEQAEAYLNKCKDGFKEARVKSNTILKEAKIEADKIFKEADDRLFDAEEKYRIAKNALNDDKKKKLSYQDDINDIFDWFDDVFKYCSYNYKDKD